MKRIDKPWGYEILWALTGKYAGKILHVRRGASLSLQYHRYKDETMYLFHGLARIELGMRGKIRSRTLVPGNAVRIPPGRRHRLTALKTSTVFEVSTPQLSDVVRIEDRYGRARIPSKDGVRGAGAEGSHGRRRERTQERMR